MDKIKKWKVRHSKLSMLVPEGLHPNQEHKEMRELLLVPLGLFRKEASFLYSG